ncbi:hypothetical protein QOZ80_9BG0700790 [Eleusine coracana subsp. coracana]|nr:hypothetical protein QOZ80_9BG0700790 [Eleusine coracana subsp. coracana]
MGLHSFCEAIFIPRKQWFVAGSMTGHIKVYNYEMMQEVKRFRAHDPDFIDSLDIHPSEPYVLSAAYYDRTVKLWNWEKGWECVRTFDTVSYKAKFNPKHAEYFACATPNGVKIWNIVSPVSDDPTFILECSGVRHLDYLSRGDDLYLITGLSENWIVTTSEE